LKRIEDFIKKIEKTDKDFENTKYTGIVEYIVRVTYNDGGVRKKKFFIKKEE